MACVCVFVCVLLDMTQLQPCFRPHYFTLEPFFPHFPRPRPSPARPPQRPPTPFPHFASLAAVLSRRATRSLLFVPSPAHQKRRTHAALRSPTSIPVGLQQRAECREFLSRVDRIGRGGGGGKGGLLNTNQVICWRTIINIRLQRQFNLPKNSLEIPLAQKVRTSTEQSVIRQRLGSFVR